MNTQKALQQAIQAIQSGNRETGKRLLADLLRVAPQNIQAWLWMSGVLESADQRRECLLRVLSLDPQNQAAQVGLARLAEQSPGPAERYGRATGQSSSPSAETDSEDTTVDDWDRFSADTAATHLDSAARIDRAPEWEAQPAISNPGPKRNRRGHRYIMLAGALSLTLLCGLAMLVFTLIQIVPQTRMQWALTPEPVLSTATLWCPSCERQGHPVVLSTRIGASFYRGAQAETLPHGTRVSVLRYRWSPLERRYYALIAAKDKRGWVPEAQIRR